MILLVACLLPATFVWAQDDEKPIFPLETIYAKRQKSAFRTIFKNFRVSVFTGYGKTFMRHEFDDFGIDQRTGLAPRIYPLYDPTTFYTNWVNTFTADSVSSPPDSYLVNGDTATLGFRGKGTNIPIMISLHYEIKGKYRIGGGYGYERMWLGNFEPLTFPDQIGNFRPANPSGWMRKYYGQIGYSFYRLDQFLFTGDLQIGGYKPGKNFNIDLIQRGVYGNLGVTIERELSEYLRGFIRPSFELKKYTLSLPDGTQPINHRMNAAYLHFGLSYSLPELRKCFHKDCRIQMNHAHGNREYRSRVHPIYKKQNPHYGENHPTLIKYKGKNKRKLNPY